MVQNTYFFRAMLLKADEQYQKPQIKSNLIKRKYGDLGTSFVLTGSGTKLCRLYDDGEGVMLIFTF